MSGFTVRPAAEGDLEALVALRMALQALMMARSATPRPPLEGAALVEAQERARLEVADWLRHPDCLMVAACDEADRPIGMAAGWLERQPTTQAAVTGLIRRVFVAEGWRQRGVGRALVARLCAFFAEQGVENISLRYVLGNAEGEGFWRRLGFQPSFVTAFATRSEVEAHLAPES